jgi:amino acid adenylation domain-containing protein
LSEPSPVLRPVDFDPFAPAAEPEVRLPLTEAQAEMWTAAVMDPEANCSYNQCFAFELDGPLRLESLRSALDQVVERHDALRVVIARDGTSQTIRPPFPVEVVCHDFSTLEPASRAAEADALVASECETPFDLAEGPLIRAFVVRESDERHRFVVTVHHIVCDGWSSSVLFGDLALLYAADRIGIPARLPPAVSYRDYVAFETGADQAAAAAADEEHWAAQYRDGAPVLDLPTDRRRPPLKTYRSGREELRIDPDLYAAVKQAGARAGGTLFATLLAAYQVLLLRLSGQSDLVVGVPSAGQPRLADPNLVAHCVNTLPVRAALDPSAPFSELVREVSQELASAQDHSLLTFGSLVRRLNIPRDPSRTPLVATTFGIDKVGTPFDFGDLSIASVATPRAYSNFELQLNLVDNGSELVVECDYNADLFAAGTLARWLAHYESLLRGIVAQPDDRLDALPLLSDADLAGLLEDAGRPVNGIAGCLHERFEERARSAPERVAAVCGEESLTYDELDRLANGLALRLRELGVGPEVLVGLRCERGLGVVVGVLGILKAGGAYLPLDPAYPRERVEFMLADAGVAVAVTDSAFAQDFSGAGVVLVPLDGGLEPAAAGPESGAGPENTAYVIYTSGSTGTPKGVRISHRNVTRLFDATDEWFGFDESDVWTLFHSYAFDFSVWEMWGALLYGGRLVVVPYWVSRSPGEFRRLLVREDVTVLNQTPSAFRQLAAIEADARDAGVGALRYVIFGGEALELSSLRPWFDQHGDSRPQLVNMYGITETTVHVTYRPITVADLEAGAGSVIGVPIPDLRVLILDAHGAPVPIGVAGELYVGGAGVSGGYLNRPELTDERFVPDRFGGTGVLYRSGDLARRLESGELEYLGRIDDQVKIRGYRIELGEIEAELNREPDVDEAVVIVREDVPDDRRLVAYLVSSAEPADLVERLRTTLGARLPEYMVPAHFVLVDSLPLTPNGKLDRKALPAPDPTPVRADSARVAPRTTTEQRLAEIWSGVLHLPQVGVTENFFELGGDSLKAAQIVTAMRSVFEIDVGMRYLFEQPTIAGLAEIVDLLAVSTSRAPADGGREREEIEL